jgi:glycerophosphoryl diester phosphodiesterase
VDLDLPFVIAHRGASGHAPENTQAAVRVARALGCRWVEVDVQLSADGVPVVIHDHTLDRTTNGHGPVGGVTAGDLAALDAGSWFAPNFSDERVPTLEAILQTCRTLHLGLNIELKPAPNSEDETAEAVAAVVGEASQPLLLSSFSHQALHRLRGLVPHMPLGALFRSPPHEDEVAQVGVPVVSVHVAANRLNDRDVVRLVGAGYRVLAYTVNDLAQARRLQDWGTSAIFSDFPERILGRAPD